MESKQARFFSNFSSVLCTRKVPIKIMATWVGGGESEYFSRWPVVGAPWGGGGAGGQQLVSQVLPGLFITQEALGAESVAVLARSADLSRCIILCTSQS